MHVLASKLFDWQSNDYVNREIIVKKLAIIIRIEHPSKTNDCIKKIDNYKKQAHRYNTPRLASIRG